MRLFYSFLMFIPQIFLIPEASPSERAAGIPKVFAEADVWRFPRVGIDPTPADDARQGELRNRIEAETERLAQKLTVDQVIALMGGQSFYTAVLHTDEGEIPPIAMTDAGLGVVGPPATAFPANTLMAATFNPELVRAGAASLADEVRSNDRNTVLGPCINIHRSVRGGRDFESYGEDPFLAARMSSAFVQGSQNRGVITATKHFALNNQETDRMAVDVHASELAIHEIYLPAFAAAVDAGSWSVMSAYNKVNGHYASESDELLNQTLKKDWGFGGFVVSDWGAAHTLLGSVLGGLDLEMPTAFIYWPDHLRDLYRQNILSDQFFHDEAKRFLRPLLSMGILSTKNLDRNELHFPSLPGKGRTALINEASDRAVRNAAQEGITLLKNNQNLLPIDPATIRTLAIIGPNAINTPYQGGGSAYVTARSDVGAFVGLADRLKDWPIEIRYARGTAIDWRSHKYIPGEKSSLGNELTNWIGRSTAMNDLFHDDSSEHEHEPEPEASSNPVEDAVRVARSSDLAILFVGLNPKEEGEGHDRLTYHLPSEQEKLIDAVLRAQPKTIIVLNGGSAIALPWARRASTLLEVWYAGERGGEAIADVLTGVVNPSGKSPVTFAAREEDFSDYEHFPGSNHVVDYAEGIFVGYRSLAHRHIEPLFPFGFGLSYTHFSFSKAITADWVPAQVPLRNWPRDLAISFDLTNDGAKTGRDVAQVYVGPQKQSGDRSSFALKGFQKIELAPHETRRVAIPLSVNAFAHFEENSRTWKIDPGSYLIRVGNSSRRDEKNPLETVITID